MTMKFQANVLANMKLAVTPNACVAAKEPLTSCPSPLAMGD